MIQTRSTGLLVWRHLRKNFWKVWICGDEKEEAAMTRTVELGARHGENGSFPWGNVQYRVIT